MGRRNRNKYHNDPYYGVIGNANRMEEAVIAATVKCNFTLDDVARWLWPDEQIAALKAAYPHTRHLDRTVWNGSIHSPYVQINLGLNCPKIRMLCPIEKSQSDQKGRDPNGILAALDKVYAAHLQFEKVRTVCRWLEAHATLNAAKYYFPVLAALFDQDAPYHAISDHNLRFKEPDTDMARITPLMREAGEIVAGAVMCNRDFPDLSDFTVSFKGVRTNLDTTTTSEYTSQGFGLL